MKRLIVDGYNLAHCLGHPLSSKTLERTRKSLEQKLCAYASKYKADITVVYDGRGVLGSCEKHGPLAIIFTPDGESADERIKSLIDAAPSRSLTVVSSDRNIRDYARISGVTSLSCQDFLSSFLQDTNVAQSLPKAAKPTRNDVHKKSASLSEQELQEWKNLFGTNS
jgi:predicted RNA-binding protein with PIN domain